jgi:hypothetical protein
MLSLLRQPTLQFALQPIRRPYPRAAIVVRARHY